MMKIAVFYELDLGGAKRAVFELSKRLNFFFDIDLYYVGEDKEENINLFFNNIFFYPFISKIWKGNNWKTRLYKDSIELINLYRLHKKIAKDIKALRYDYIFVHPSKFTQAPFLLRFLKNKCIYFCQEPLRIVYDPYWSNLSSIKFPKNIYEYCIRQIRKYVDYKNFVSSKIVLANSNYSKDLIEKSYHRKAEVCYLGVDIDFFKPLNLDKTIDILFIGNIKEYDFLMDSIKFFKTKPRLFTIFREDKKNIISDYELVKIYNKSKVLVSLNRNEPFGLIPLEAMASGAPVIAIKEGGYKESIIDSKTGFLVSRDPMELYEKINKLITNDGLRNDMAKASRKNVLNNWTWDKSVERFLKIIGYET